jgi:hypothetical protein
VDELFVLANEFFLCHQVYERTHLGIDKFKTEHIRQEKDSLFFGVFSSRCGDIGLDPADLLNFTCVICRNVVKIGSCNDPIDKTQA